MRAPGLEAGPDEAAARRRPWLTPARRRGVAVAILVTGLTASLAIFLAAGRGPEGPPGPGDEDSKQYLRRMEVIGGKANVLATELREWFQSIWHGRRLAATVAVLTLLGCLLFLIASTPLPHPAPSPPGRKDGDGEGRGLPSRRGPV